MQLKQEMLFFEYDGATYELTTTEKETSTEVVKDGEVYATVSNLLVSPQAKGVFLSLSFKEAVEQAIADKALHLQLLMRLAKKKPISFRPRIHSML